MNRVLALAGLIVSALGTLLLPATPAAAHPLGNLSVNQYAALTVSPSGVHVDYVLDLAELPAFTARRQDIDTDYDGTIADGERDTYAQQSCTRAAAADTLRLGGTPMPLRSSSAALTFPSGAAGLHTLRLECGLDAAAPITADTEVSFAYGEYTDRIGWREIVLVADGVTISHSTAPATSISDRLSRYPTSALIGAPDSRTAVATVRPGAAAAGHYQPDGNSAAVNRLGVDRLTAAFTSLVDHRQLTLTFALGALLIAMVLGGAHALAPGHGKLMMAGYLVNERGNLGQALAIAGTVALTHTLGVLTLGLVLATGLHFAPQRIYTGLTALSGLLVAAVGAILLVRAWRTWRHQRAHRLGQAHDHGHAHDGHAYDGHDHGFGHHTHHPTEPIRGRGIIAMGLAGGLSPSPSAIVVLLGAVALGRAWYGVLLVAAYGIGMAVTLTGIGYALTRVRARLERRPRAWLSHRAWRLVPLITSSLIIIAGLGVATTALLR